MTNGAEDITSLECQVFDNSKAKKIYDKFPEICEDDSDILKHFTETKGDSEYCSSVANKLNELKIKLIEILKGRKEESKVIFFDGDVVDVKRHCICLKQWFYNEIIKDVKNETNRYKFLKTCNNDIKDKINRITSNICTFRNLNFREILRMKTIIDFYLFYYKRIKDYTPYEKTHTHAKYFRTGFYDHCNGIIECLNSTSSGEYCEEFKEYHNNYNAFKIYLESLTSYKEKVDGSDCTNGCVLGESLFKGNYLLELKKEIEEIRSRYRPTNYSTTVITVVFLIIGTIIGAFLISYYFFGVNRNSILKYFNIPS
ncbi:PIR Superfamily Protein [Plasmodium ovale wallikeri]|uniref:PIR Superfamily Protein n=1 Tax=Plasmodium ovale wallikeri TaxID=864142 RepID=A0A1A9AIX8_PLAOA|nr:PIR Superfamily Protein [Plasmodium ovale wallikeri]